MTDPRPDYPGTFVSFEGLDGAGKSTQIEIAASKARESGREVLIVREPGGTKQGELQRALVKADVDSLVAALASCGADEEKLRAAMGTSEAPLVALPEDTTPLTQLFMFNVARAQLFAKTVIPALERGAIVLADRSVDSNIAYQSGSGGLEPDLVMDVCMRATGGVMPDLTIYCRLDAQTRLDRMKARGLAEDVIERSSNFDKIAETFDALAAMHPERFVVVDANRTIGEVAAEIGTHLDPFLSPDHDEIDPLFEIDYSKIRPTL
jgi:dTMP kinase